MPKLINLLSYELTDRLLQYIDENAISPNQKLPSERDLSLLFKVNRTTLRSTLQKLVDDGILISVPNSGYYKAYPKFQKYCNYYFTPLLDPLLQNTTVSVKKIAISSIYKSDIFPFNGSDSLPIKQAFLETVDDTPSSLFFLSHNLSSPIQNMNFKNSFDNTFRKQVIYLVRSDKALSELLQIDIETELFFIKEEIFDLTDNLLGIAVGYTIASLCEIRIDVTTMA